MAIEDDDIDKLFKDKLRDLESDPMPNTWHKIQNELDLDLATDPTLTKPKPLVKSIYWYAAASIVAIFAVWITYQSLYAPKTDTNPITVTNQTDIESEDSTRSIQTMDVPLKKDVPQAVQNTKSDKSEKKVYSSENVPKKITLDDGTTVTLNKNSKITLSDNFHTKRELNLDGGAYFEASKSTKNVPFVVLINDLKIDGSNSNFTVTTDAQSKSRIVYVNDGSVKAFLDHQEVLINTHQSAHVTSLRISEAKDLKTQNFNSWIDGKLVFDNTDFETVMGDVEQFYGVKVSIGNKELNNCRFTGTFDKASLDEILQVLSATFNLKQDKKDGGYVIYGKGCK